MAKQYTEKNLKVLNAFHFVLGYKLSTITKGLKNIVATVRDFSFSRHNAGCRGRCASQDHSGTQANSISFHMASISGPKVAAIPDVTPPAAEREKRKSRAGSLSLMR